MTIAQDDKARQSRAEHLAGRMGEVRAAAGFRPLVVEFAGSPKAGKSTNIDIVTHFFKRTGFKVWSPTEGASKRTPYQLRRDLVAFNAWALNYAVSEILVACHNVEGYDLVVLDRGPFDSLAWMRILKDGGELDEDGYRRIEDFARHPKWAGLVGRVCLFACAPRVSLERENEAKLIRREGTAMNAGMLGKLRAQYEAMKGEDGRIRVFETDNGGGPRDTAREIADDILSLLEEKADAGA